MTLKQEYFIHHVYFWFKKPLTEDIKKKFEMALIELTSIETIIGVHLGIPAGTDRGVIDKTYSFSLLLTFRNKEDQDIYQDHPKHLKFIEEWEDYWEKVIVYDSVGL